jgi:Holliday junction resolvase RusA-like endonuclease
MKKETPADIIRRVVGLRGDFITTYLSKKGIRVDGAIHAVLASKSNSRNVAVVQRPGRKPQRIPIIEKKAREFYQIFKVAAIASGFGRAQSPRPPFAGEWKLLVNVYQENRRRDLDIELLADALQRFGVIENDRHIWEKHCRRFIDKENPRVEFALIPFDESAPAPL